MKKLKIVLLGFIVLVGLVLLTGCEYKTTNSSQGTTQTKQVKECEHDWVVTSKYNFWTESYKTISKCSKCGKVIE